MSLEEQALQGLRNQCSHNFPVPPPPPPVPPPPPPQPPVSSPVAESLTNASTKISDQNGISISTTYDTFYSTPKQEALKACQLFMNNRMKNGEDCNSFIFISCYRPVKPVIQNGPLCGIVALSMAMNLLSDTTITTEEIFAEAKRAGYSLQGEMFSAHSMQELAAKLYLQGPVRLLKCENGNPVEIVREEVISGLVDGHCLLVPYDADKNHGPCLAKGHKAHWALVTGFFAAFDKSIHTHLQNFLEAEEKTSNLFYWNDYMSDETVKDALKTVLKSSEMFVFAHQGKSKYCGIWGLEELLSSNNNLHEVDPERNSVDYVLPSTGITEELRSKIVMIHNVKR